MEDHNFHYKARFVLNDEFEFECDLIDSAAAELWRELVKVNSRFFENTWKEYIPSLRESKPKDTTLFTEQIQQHTDRLTQAIDECNSYIEGTPFPIQPNIANYSKKYLQQIHRCFVTAAVTHRAWEHGIDKDVLIKLKSEGISSEDLYEYVKGRCNNQFTINEGCFDQFMASAERINKEVHALEHFYHSPLGAQLAKDWNFMMYRIGFDQDKGSITSKDDGDYIRTRKLSIDQIRQSMPSSEQYSQYDIYIQSYIYGKQYLETFTEDHIPYEFDVTNVSDISGEWLYMPYNSKRRQYFSDSPFTDWCHKYHLPAYMYKPLPLGKCDNKTRVRLQRYLKQEKPITKVYIHTYMTNI